MWFLVKENPSTTTLQVVASTAPSLPAEIKKGAGKSMVFKLPRGREPQPVTERGSNYFNKRGLTPTLLAKVWGGKKKKEMVNEGQKQTGRA